MSRNNRGSVKAPTRTPVVSTAPPVVRTALGAQGYTRDLQSELFLLAACNLPGEKAFHEGTDARVKRFRDLVREAAGLHAEWTAGLLAWMRGPGNLRLAPVEAAAEYAHAWRDAADSPAVPVRKVVDSVLQRADEPGEIIAYWLARYGRKMPIGFKRGIADAVGRLYTERAVLKYDTPEAAIRFGDVIELVQPRYTLKAYGTWHDALYRHAIERRHGRPGKDIPDTLPMLARHRELMSIPVAKRREFLGRLEAPRILGAAGMTWEALSGWLQGPMDAQAWKAIIPSMRYGALLKNLRNFDQAGVSDETAEVVAALLADPGEVAGSRLFPFRFLSAYRAAASQRWSYPLDKALNLSLANVPALRGRTLVLVDRSPSMWDQKFSEHSDMPWADGAAIFGAAIALRAEHADLVEFWGKSQQVRISRAESVLKVVERFSHKPAPGGTDIPLAVKTHLRAEHTRVVIVTDEQTRAGYLPSNMWRNGGMQETLIDDLVPASVPLYMWNFGGYSAGATPSGSGTRVTLGGLTDAAFRIIPVTEAGRDAIWPWDLPAAG